MQILSQLLHAVIHWTLRRFNAKINHIHRTEGRMNNGWIINRWISQSAESVFKRERKQIILRLLLISTVSIFFVETLVMILLEVVFSPPKTLVLLLDGLILVTVLLPLNYFLFVLPVSEQMEQHFRTNQELVHSNGVLERFFSISDLLIAYMDVDFNFIRVNSAYARTGGGQPEDYAGKNHFTLFPNPENEAIFKNVVASGKTFIAVEKPFVFSDHPEWGITYWDWNLQPIKNNDGVVTELILVVSNATSRKLAQLALVDSERRFRAAFNQTFQYIALLDPSGCAQLVNQTALDFSGLTHEEVAGKPLGLIPWWDGDGETVAKMQAAVDEAAAGNVVQFEYAMRTAGGETATLDITIKPVLDENGETVLLIFEGRDITRRIQTELALIQSESEIQRLYQAEMHARQLAETLRSANMALTGSLNIDTVLDTLLEHLAKVVPYTSAHVDVLDEHDRLVVRAGRGEENWAEAYRQLNRQYDTNELPFLRPLLEDHQPISITDTILHPASAVFPIDRYVRSWLGLPLLVGDQLIGVCILEHNCPNFFTPEMVSWATALTNQAGVAIQNAWLFSQVQEGRGQLQALSRRLVDVQESERLYIARELHDEAGQALASLMVGLHLLEHDSGDQPEVVARSNELKQIVDTVLENLHRLAIDLRPASLDHLGLIPALRQQAETIGEKHKLTVQFATVGRMERLPVEAETAIYRIVQEALTNVVRHAHASRVDVLLERRGNRLVVVVEDNGVGFDPSSTKDNRLGMVGMRERAVMLDGSLIVESAPGKGTTIVLEVPCPSES